MRRLTLTALCVMSSHVAGFEPTIAATPALKQCCRRAAPLAMADFGVGRRLLLSGAAAMIVLAPPAAAAESSIGKKLSRVPVFVITNKDEAPYLTEVDENGRRSGFFYLSPQTAIKVLADVRTFDPRASLSVVSLDAIWFDIAKTAEEVAKAPQPKAGTSTDLRLFRLSPLEDEVAGAKDKFKSGAGLQDGDTPLFYDESFLLTRAPPQPTGIEPSLGALGAPEF